MTKNKLIKDNFLLLIGGNLGNVFSFLFNIILIRVDPVLANLYVAYNSVVLILGVPALVLMRLFTVYGDTVIYKLKNFYLNRQLISNITIIIFLFAFIPLNFIIQRFTQDSNFLIAFMIISLSVATTIAYIFRGLKQYEEDFLPTVISLNIETGGRLILGYIFGVTLGFGINGVMIGAILAMILSLVPVFHLKYLFKISHHVSSYKLMNAFFSTLVFTAGIEFFSNFDIAYSLNQLQNNIVEQTEYNILQVFRKIIFYGIFIVSAMILAVGSKNNHSKKFVFFYTLGSGLSIGVISAIAIYLFRNIILILLNQRLEVVDTATLLNFLIFTAFMSTTYLLSNWLLSQKKFIYTLIPMISVIVQIFVYITADKNLKSLLSAYLTSTSVFFALTTITGIYIVFFNKNE